MGVKSALSMLPRVTRYLSSLLSYSSKSSAVCNLLLACAASPEAVACLANVILLQWTGMCMIAHVDVYNLLPTVFSKLGGCCLPAFMVFEMLYNVFCTVMYIAECI